MPTSASVAWKRATRAGWMLELVAVEARRRGEHLQRARTGGGGAPGRHVDAAVVDGVDPEEELAAAAGRALRARAHAGAGAGGASRGRRRWKSVASW